MSFSVTGAFAIGGVNSGIFNTDSYQVSDDVTLVRGNHQLGARRQRGVPDDGLPDERRVGRHLDCERADHRVSVWPISCSDVWPAWNTEPANALPMDMWYQGVYAQDTWRASSRVTVNAGIRWEPFLGQSVTNGAIYNWDIDNFRRNVTSEVFLRAPAGFTYPGDDGFPDGKTGQKKQWLNFSPRVGAGVGRARRRPDGGADLLRHRL